MSSGSLAALPASDENEETAVEGRGAGLAAKARCPAVVRDGPQALAGQGPLGCARATRPAGGEMRIHGRRDLPLGLPGGRGAAGPRGCSEPPSPITSGCSGLLASLLAWSRCGLSLPHPPTAQVHQAAPL